MELKSRAAKMTSTIYRKNDDVDKDLWEWPGYIRENCCRRKESEIRGGGHQHFRTGGENADVGRLALKRYGTHAPGRRNGYLATPAQSERKNTRLNSSHS